jgi:hypothetical protein
VSARMTEPSQRASVSRKAGPGARLATLLLLGLVTGHGDEAAAQGAGDLVGRWHLTLVDRGTEHSGILEIERSGDALQAFVDGGPAALGVEGADVRLEIDTRDGGGRLLSYGLSGTLRAGALTGRLQPPLDAPAGTWHAERVVDRAEQPPRPVDFTGIWSRISSGIAKVHLDYTPSAQAVVDAYHWLDDPALRCVSPGLVRVSGWPYPLEIVQNEDQVTILYESFHEVRRIFLDGREIPADLPPRSMGFSFGHWDGSTLVVETDRLLESYVDLNGQPLSEDARVAERMSLSEDGQTLRSEMTVYDPANYNRPITRHRAWRRTPETVILEYDCDPYPFFRGLELEGKLQEYWDRMRRR